MIWSLAFYGEDRKCVTSFVRRHVRFADCFTTILATWSSHLTCSSFLILEFFHQLELAPAPESFPTTGRNLKQPKVLLFSPYSTRCLEMDIPCNLFGGLVPDITGTNEEVEKIVDTIGIGEMAMNQGQRRPDRGHRNYEIGGGGFGRHRPGRTHRSVGFRSGGYGSDSDSSYSREKGCCTMM